MEGNNINHTFDSIENDNEFTLIATDQLLATSKNENILYCVLNASKESCDESVDRDKVISLSHSRGVATVNAKAPGTSQKTVWVRAYLKEGELITSKKDIEVTINPTKQELTWAGSNIQWENNAITADGHQTWKLKLKYDSDKDATSNKINLDLLMNEVSATDTHIGLKTNLIVGVTPDIAYEVQLSKPLDDMGKVKIDNGILEITDVPKGNVSIEATAKATGNYGATVGDDEYTTNVNEYSHAKLNLVVTQKPAVEFEASYTGDNILTGDDSAKGSSSLGTLKFNPSSTTGYTFAIESAKVKDETNSTPESPVYINMHDAFEIKNTNQLFTKSALSKGTYVVKVKATNTTTGETATAKEITILVNNSDFDVSTIGWQFKADKPFDFVGGQIDNQTKRNTENLAQTYAEDGVFYVKINNLPDQTSLENATITYALNNDSTKDLITVGSDGKVTIKGASKEDSELLIEATITIDDVDTQVYLPIMINKAEATMGFVKKNNTVYELVNASDKTKYKKQTYTYVTGTAALLDIFTKGAPEGSDVTIKIEYSGSWTENDVLKFAGSDAIANANTDKPKVCVIKKEDYATGHTSKCQAEIQNALKNKASDAGKVKLTASVAESDNYKAMTIEMPIDVNKAENSDFAFADSEIWLESNINGKFDPVFKSKDTDHPNIGIGDIQLLLSNEVDDPGFASDEVLLNEDNKVDSGYIDGVKGFKYNIVVPKTATDNRLIHVYAQKDADRNYNKSAIKDLKVYIMPEGTSQFQFEVKSYNKVDGPGSSSIVYGDAYIAITPRASNDEEETIPPTYEYTVEDAYKAYVEPYGSNKNEFKPIKVGEDLKIKAKRTTSNGTVSQSNITIRIKPKTIKLKVSDLTKQSGMKISNTEYSLTTTPDFLASDKDKLDIKYNSVDKNSKELVDLEDGIRNEHNNNAITANVINKNENDDVLSNYKIENVSSTKDGIESGKLIVEEIESQASWFETKAAIDNIQGSDDWYNGDVEVHLKSTAGSFDRISNDAKDWQTKNFTISMEGKNAVDVYFRQSSGENAGAISKKQMTEIKIDKTKPKITKVTGTKVNDNGVAKFMNTITFGTFFKPGVEVVMESEDKNANASIATSGIESIAYKAYVKDGDSFNLLDEDDASMSGTIGKVILLDPGVYRVCATAKDKAGNVSDEYCSELDVKKLEVDIDGDGTKDMIDSDGDGCPDINIVLGKDESGNWIKLNTDRNSDKLPDLNIDSDGDGIPELNIDTDEDGKPDINLVNITSSMWKPMSCITSQSEQYCTTSNLKATINVDTNNDLTPDINIDTNGDMKANINIAKDGSTTPTSNLLLDKNIVWKPDSDFTKDKFTYDTMDKLKPELNIDSNDDGLPDINVDVDGDGKPDINIDVDGDGIPDINIDGNGDGKPDYNVDSDGDGKGDKNNIDLDEWDPSIKNDDFGTMDITTKNSLEDNGVKVEKPNGGLFLPKYAIKVDDVTTSIENGLKTEITKVIGNNQEIKQVYNVALMKGSSAVQPDGSLKIRIPVVNGLKNPRLVITQKDGTQKVVAAVIEDGYYVYESDYLGIVSVIGDKVKNTTTKDPVEEKPATPNTKEPTSNQGTSVKGNYVNNGIGGANTGDENQVVPFVIGMITTVAILFFLAKKLSEEE